MADSEKITINLGAVDLGKIDLLVEEGFYGNRADFIRTAIRNQLDSNGEMVRQVTVRRDFVIGALSYNRKDLEKYREKGEKVSLQVIGTLMLDDDIPAELVQATISKVRVYGALRASDEVREILAKIRG
ncbi:MAG: CopG family transcriptional regulator [Chloroflexota bacterium]